MSLTPEQAREAKEILDGDSCDTTAEEVARKYGYPTARGLRSAIGQALQKEKKAVRPEIAPGKLASAIAVKAPADGKDRDDELLAFVISAVKAARARIITSACAVEIIRKAVG